jgi:protein TonB
MRERTQNFLVYGFLISAALHLVLGPLVRFERTPVPPEWVDVVRVERMPTPPPTAPPTRPPPTPSPPPERRPPTPRAIRVVVPHVAPKTAARPSAPPAEAVAQPVARAALGEPTTAPVPPVATPVPLPVSTPQVSVATAPPLPAPAATVDPSVLAAYNARLNAAVQAAFRIPSAAADMGFKGRVRVEFTLRDGVVTDARVVQPCGLPMIDRAALAAVQSAKYPPPPQVLQGKSGVYQIWVVVS